MFKELKRRICVPDNQYDSLVRACRVDQTEIYWPETMAQGCTAWASVVQRKYTYCATNPLRSCPRLILEEHGDSWRPLKICYHIMAKKDYYVGNVLISKSLSCCTRSYDCIIALKQVCKSGKISPHQVQVNISPIFELWMFVVEKFRKEKS